MSPRRLEYSALQKAGFSKTTEPNMRGLKILVVLFWIVLVTVTVHAVMALGAEGGMVFLTDFSHPWRAQFNTDFSMHIVLFMIWVIWREDSKVFGIAAALLSLMGGLFTFVYLLIAMLRANNDPKKFILGAHA